MCKSAFEEKRNVFMEVSPPPPERLLEAKSFRRKGLANWNHKISKLDYAAIMRAR